MDPGPQQLDPSRLFRIIGAGNYATVENTMKSRTTTTRASSPTGLGRHKIRLDYGLTVRGTTRITMAAAGPVDRHWQHLYAVREQHRRGQRARGIFHGSATTRPSATTPHAGTARPSRTRTGRPAPASKFSTRPTSRSTATSSRITGRASPDWTTIAAAGRMVHTGCEISTCTTTTSFRVPPLAVEGGPDHRHGRYTAYALGNNRFERISTFSVIPTVSISSGRRATQYEWQNFRETWAVPSAPHPPKRQVSQRRELFRGVEWMGTRRTHRRNGDWGASDGRQISWMASPITGPRRALRLTSGLAVSTVSAPRSLR